jgi:hypothetical protein
MIALFTSLIVASDYALSPLVNVKLVDTLVFAAAFAFGFRMGATIAITSELVWGIVSPYGFGGYIIPFLVAGEILYAFAGYIASKIWSREGLDAFSQKNLYFGAIIAVCAFFWDIETNLATGLMATWPNLSPYTLAYVFTGVPFMIPHEIGDFVIGSALAPIAIAFFMKTAARRSLIINKEVSEVKQKIGA